MAKSKYPNKIDTSAEIPHVRDNITEIGSDVINSIRTAIFQIEKTLGTNPQGAVGNTVSNRLSRVIDDKGNLKKDALNRSNILSGPIIDSDISKVAAIQESKLKLDFPTQLLQDEISIINRQIEGAIKKVDELNYILSAHVSLEATNRHRAKAITVEQGDDLGSSSSAIVSFEEQDLQNFIGNLYSSHINYSGENISSINSSHSANQIFFDNSSISDIVNNSSVQGAIEDIAGIEGAALRENTLNLNSNGIIRSGSVIDGYEGLDRGFEIVISSPINYESLTGKSTTVFYFSEQPVPSVAVSEFDLLNVLGSSVAENNKSYKIKNVTLSGDGGIVSVEVYGAPTSESEDGIYGSISKNTYQAYNPNSLNCTVRYRKNKTNTPDIQVSNPDSATIITRGLNPDSISQDSSSFNISIDGNDEIEINTFDSNYKKQTLDTIISKINKTSIDNHLNIMAYKMKVSRCYELAISHNMPNHSSDVISRTLKITNGGENDGTENLGMSYLLNNEYRGTTGNLYHINGLILSNFGKIRTYTSSEVQISNDLTINSIGDVDFISNKIRVGDLVVITNSTYSPDDGTYRILEVSPSVITIDYDGGTFSGELNGSSIVHIIRSCAIVSELDFLELGPISLGPVPTVGCVLFDVFIDENNDIMFRKRLEQSGILAESGVRAVVVDVSNNFITSGQVAKVSIDSSGYATLSGPDFSSSGPAVNISSDGIYKVFAADKMSYIILQVEFVSPPASTIFVDIYGFDELRYDGLRLCRGVFATSIGRVISTSSVSSENKNGIPVILDKRITGTTDHTIISEPFIEKYIQGPRNELRGSGVVRGCLVSGVAADSDSLGNMVKLNISAGVVVINGIRYEFEGVRGYKKRVADKDFYIAIDSSGCIVADYEYNGISPFSDSNVAHLAMVKISESSGTNIIITYDLRLFIDNVDYKIISDITVSNDARFSHFVDIKDAVKYAMMFDRMFPKFNATPSVLIKEGQYYIDEPIIISKDITISGVGNSTVISRGGSFRNLCNLSEESEYIPNAYKSLFIIGDAEDVEIESYETKSSSKIINGITFKNFVYNCGGDVSGVGSIFSISQEASGFEQFVFKNISFIGPENAENTSSGSGCNFEWMASIAAQPDSSGSSKMFSDDDVKNANGERRKFRGIIINNCRFKKIGCGASIICVGGKLKHSVISNNIVIDLPIITGRVSIPTEKGIWKEFEYTEGFSKIERPGIHNFKTKGYPRDWFFNFASAGHGWRTNNTIFGEDYLVSNGVGYSESSNTIVVGSSVENILAEKEYEEPELL